MACCPRATAQEVSAPEPQLKAAFLYNFSKLVSWPTNAFASTNAPLVIAVLGQDPVAKELGLTLTGRRVAGRELKTFRLDSMEAATNCHVLFISGSERRDAEHLATALRHQPVLTVSDMKGFASWGMIELVRTNNNFDLRINPGAAREAGLELSSHLTRLDRSLRPGATNAPPPQNH